MLCNLGTESFRYTSSSNGSEETKEEERKTQEISENQQNDPAKSNTDRINECTHFALFIDSTKTQPVIQIELKNIEVRFWYLLGACRLFYVTIWYFLVEVSKRYILVDILFKRRNLFTSG